MGRTIGTVLGIFGALTIAAALGGCGDDAASNEASGGPPIDGRVALGELTEPIDCPDTTACTRGEASPYSLAFETPENIELLPEQSGLLGFDRTAKQFVAYQTTPIGRSDPASPRNFEMHRFDPRYDRVQIVGNAVALGCAGRTCDIVGLSGGAPRHVPDEVSARWFDGRCVGGDGIVCQDNDTLQWSWVVPGSSFEAPIAFFVELGDKEFLAVDIQGATWLVLGSKVQPYDMAEVGEPLVALAKGSGGYGDRRQWMGRTASGRLVLGSLKRAHTCESIRADAIIATYPSAGPAYRQGQSITGYWDQGCTTEELPPDAPGVGYAYCGMGMSRFAFDRHRVLAQAPNCVVD